MRHGLLEALWRGQRLDFYSGAGTVTSGIACWVILTTLFRFVRFVSTPEVLERVTTLESEILQLEDAIAIQSNDNLGLKSVSGGLYLAGCCLYFPER